MTLKFAPLVTPGNYLCFLENIRNIGVSWVRLPTECFQELIAELTLSSRMRGVGMFCT